MDRVVLVVPCFNEAERLDVEAFWGFVPEGAEVELLFVNDGSTDATAERLREVTAKRSAPTRVLELPKNQGKAEAVRAGMLDALQGDPDAVGFWDADLSTPLIELLDFCDMLDERPGLAMVFGARVKLQGRTIERNGLRHYSGRVFATAVANLLRLPIYDTQCGAKLFRVGPALREVLERPFISRWVFDVEILARFIARSERPEIEKLVYELPVREWRDRPGSKVGLSGYARSVIDMIRIYRAYGALRGNR